MLQYDLVSAHPSGLRSETPTSFPERNFFQLSNASRPLPHKPSLTHQVTVGIFSTCSHDTLDFTCHNIFTLKC